MNRRFAGITLGDYIREYSTDLTSNSRDKAGGEGEKKNRASRAV